MFHGSKISGRYTPEEFQFRDLRGKAGTDKTESIGDIRQAQKQ
jgi:hypothetical protein